MYGSRLPLFFVTKDLGLELGTQNKPKKARVLATYENIFVYSSNPNTSFGGCVHSINTLINDIGRVS